MKTNINKNQIKLPGGTTGQALVKLSNADYDFDWADVVGIGGAGGTLIDSDTTQFTVINGTGVNSLAYTINVPGGTLGTKNAIRVSLLNSAYTAASGSSLSVSISYGGQLVGSGSVSVGLSGKMDVSALIVAAGSTNAQKSIAKSISQNTTTGGQITAFTSDYATTVDSTINQNITVEISGSLGVSTQQTIEGIIVEKISAAGAGSLTFKNGAVTPSGTTYVIAHGLGVIPTIVKIYSVGSNNIGSGVLVPTILIGTYDVVNSTGTLTGSYPVGSGSGTVPVASSLGALPVNIALNPQNFKTLRLDSVDTTNLTFTTNTNVAPWDLAISWEVWA